MKTSKRLLSILLMLAMLVSMFTVVAFAYDRDLVDIITPGGSSDNDDTEDCFHIDEETFETLFVKVKEKKANCVDKGEAEHYECSECGATATYDGSKYVIGPVKTTPVDPTNHKTELRYVKATRKAIAHWHCDSCGYDFSDEEG